MIEIAPGEKPGGRPHRRGEPAGGARRAHPGDHPHQEDGRGPDATTSAKSGIRARYLHSEINTIERVEIIRDLRKGEFDCLVGINLLREGLDLPEVSLVAILDADKEGFLRSSGSLIQTSGRAARNLNGRVIMYADRITDSMREAIEETDRRSIQEQYNREHNITPAIDKEGDPRHHRAGVHQ